MSLFLSGIEISFVNNPSFDLSFQKLPSLFYEKVKPTPLTDAHRILFSPSCLDLLEWNLSPDHLEDFTRWINGETQIAGDQRIATRYAGHQFGVWAGQLGDGRAISLGEILNSRNERWEIQTKGSGLTPFSRMGDGKAVIRSSVREYLCSEAMAALGIPTTRALILLTGKDPVFRETVERSALIARVFPSNLRFGHFEYGFHFGFKAELQALIEYSQKNFFPEQKTLRGMLEQIVLRTAELMAQWQAVGFCHGVMNTDNMSLLGLTLDYGPFGFMEDTQLNHVCNHSDTQGRYAYFRQPQTALWNLDRLMVCFSEILPIPELQTVLSLYGPHYEKHWLRNFGSKLGLAQARPEDATLVQQLLEVLHQNRIDFTYFFRSLSAYALGQPDSLGSFFGHYPRWENLLRWLEVYDARLKEEERSSSDRHTQMRATNPKYVLRNYIAEEVIQTVEADQSERIQEWMKVLYSPYDEHPDFHAYSLPTPPQHRDLSVSCSS